MSITVAKGKVSRTKKCIIDALLYLMEVDEFEKITVTQITQEADVARRTFYLNYNSKYEVLESYINILYEEYTAEVLEQGNRSFEHDVSQFFVFWEKHSEILFLLEKNNIFMVLLSKFEEILAETAYFDFSFWYDKGIDRSKRDYIASILAAILWRVLGRWVKNDLKEPVEDLVDTFMKTIK